MAKRPSIGRMREKLHFQKRAMVDDGYGNETAGDFATVLTVPAELVPLRGGEGVQASRLTGTQPYIVRIHNHQAAREIAPAWRAVDARNDKRVLNIRTVTNPDQKNGWLELLVDDGVAT